ncbi:MAG TPA: hypothetical protein VLH19_02025 [Patescibacteria group bacterium]|nr:hypothetical protein [Patescibacteria group bacterium]
MEIVINTEFCDHSGATFCAICLARVLAGEREGSCVEEVDETADPEHTHVTFKLPDGRVEKRTYTSAQLVELRGEGLEAYLAKRS